jgi:hypothetical protein
MGKKSREKRAKQLERDRKREGEGKASPGATSRVTGPADEVPPAHHDTPAAAAVPSTDDTHDDEPASTTVSAFDSTAAVAEKLDAFCRSCTDRLGEDIVTWVNGEFSGSVAAVKAAARRGDAKAQYAIGFMMAFRGMSGGYDVAISLLRKATDQGYPDAFFGMGQLCAAVIVRGDFLQGREEAAHDVATAILTTSAVEHHSADAQYVLGMFDCFLHGCARSKPGMLKTAR